MNRKQIASEFSKSLNYPEIEKIILFGSVAKGEDKKDSGIDILIISREKSKTKDKVMRKVSDVLLSKGVYISVKVISPDEYMRLKTPILFLKLEKKV